MESVDLSGFDFILAMQPSIAAELEDRGIAASRIQTLDVDDPYGKDIEEYRDVAAKIERAVHRLLPSFRTAA